MKGFIHNYTGNGKGKTSAALGLAIRALGADKKVCLIQFLKNGEYSEIKALDKIQKVFPDQLYFCQTGTDRELLSEMTKKDRIAALHGEELFFHLLDENAYDLYILDELNTAVHYKLIDSKRLIQKIHSHENHGEIVITGRYASDDLLNEADLVTEMKKIKHYIDKGIEARTGIEM
ncbi:MAG: cob(I)yrinic acid a,c-diamide adenosyltransferase [Spirochaetaceae bacterium]|nr:cob(I)yrinic acid a,c-diamide adenosyltransferase [Spirochaetaceae bacterium]